MADNKMKILLLMKLMLEETDKDHSLNAAQICEKLEARCGSSCERRTVYSDIEQLREYGIHIEQSKGRGGGYYIGSREFDLPELKLLVDAVQSSKFITKEKSEELIGKLEKQTSCWNASQLQRQVYIYNRIKTGNASIYKNVDSIHAAIHCNRQVSFKYCEWNIKKELVQRKGGSDYIISPWALTWDDENYYLVGYDAEAGKIKHYRVDKMQDIKVLGEPRLGKEYFKNFDLATLARKTFGMYGGEDRKLTLEGDNHRVGVIIDRFGKDIMISPYGEEKFHASVTVSVSPQFFGWLAGLGEGIRISWPEDVREEYKEFLRRILEKA